MIDWSKMDGYEDVIYKKGEGIALVSINRPEVHNAFRPQTTLFEFESRLPRCSGRSESWCGNFYWGRG